MLNIYDSFCKYCPQKESCKFKHGGETAIQRFGCCTAQRSAAALIAKQGSSYVPVNWSLRREDVFGK